MAVVLSQTEPIPLERQPEAASARELLVYQQPLLRGLCIACVVLTHVVSGLEKMPRYTWLTGVLVVLHSLARWAVPCFLLLSGLHLSLSRRNERARSLYRRSLKYLLIPYVLWTVVYTLIDPRGGGPLVFPRNLALASAWGHLWFMGTIIQLYLLHPFLARWYRSSSRRGWFVIAALALQTGFAVGMPVFNAAIGKLPDGAEFAVTFVRRSCLTHIGYFVVGYWVLEHHEAVVALLRRRGVAVVGAAIWLVIGLVEAGYWAWPLSRGLAFKALPDPYVLHRLLTPLMTLGALLLAGALLMRQSQASRARPSWAYSLVASLGVHSYGVYLAHPAVLVFGTWALGLIFLRHEHVTYYALLLPFTLCATLFLVRLVGRLPFGRYVG